MTTSCVHNNDPKSEITILINGITEDLLSCKNCTEKLDSFSTIQVVKHG